MPRGIRSAGAAPNARAVFTPTNLATVSNMIHARCDFFAESLSLSTSMTVLLPQPAEGQIGMVGTRQEAPPPVLYLLHGMSDDDTIWLRRTSIERYAAELGIAVVMPAVQRSFYNDEAFGRAYWTFVADELPALVGRAFTVSHEPADTYVAGLSMGGFGAVKLALLRPHQFAAAASLSGALDVAEQRFWADREVTERTRIWGQGPLDGTDNDLVHLVSHADPTTLPPLYLTCGTEDPLVEQNRTFAAAAQGNQVNLTVDLRPGSHDWAYWDATIQDVLAWLPLRNRPSGTAEYPENC